MGIPELNENARLLVQAYIDGELDPANALGIAERMRTDPALAAEGRRIETLQRIIRERVPRESAPPGLRARIEAAVGLKQKQQRMQPSWRALAASVMLAAGLASGSTWFLANSQPSGALADTLVSDHIRSLMAAQPTDVLSSDRHTIKPWFNGRIPESPRVVDLAKQDFSLIGARIDVVDQKPVPTLVYRRRQHLISLTVLPAGGPSDASSAPGAIAGYNVVRWTDHNKDYWAVSDLNRAELDEFARAIRAAP